MRHKRRTLLTGRRGLHEKVLLALPILFDTTALAPAEAQGVATDTRQGSTFNDNGTTIFCQITGTGTPPVLIHGYPMSGGICQLSR